MINNVDKNQKGFTAVEGLLIILILAVVGFGGYYVYHTNHKTKAAVSTTAAKESTASSNKSTVAKTTNPYAGWKTFCSTMGGLCLKYPTNWTFKQTLLSQSISPERDVFTSPSGSVVVDYLPRNGEGPTGNNSTVNIVSVNNTQESDMDVVGAIIKNLDGTSPGYVAQLFVTGNPNGYTTGQTLNNIYWPAIPEFSNAKLLGGKKVSRLDVEQANSTNQMNGFPTQASAQAWLDSSEVKTGQLILESAAYN